MRNFLAKFLLKRNCEKIALCPKKSKLKLVPVCGALQSGLQRGERPARGKVPGTGKTGAFRGRKALGLGGKYGAGKPAPLKISSIEE